MAKVINMPRLSDTMEEGTVVKWLKNVGDAIEEGEILAEIETDKATMEFESFDSGTLLHIGIPEGETAPVDVLLAIIGEKGEDISNLLSKGGETKTAEQPAQKEEVKEQSTATTSTTETPLTPPANVEIINMPRLSDTMEEGTVVKWLKKEGESVQEGEILAEIETDKATMEFESFYSGTLLYIGVQEGETAIVDSVLAAIGDKKTDVNNLKEYVSKIGQTTSSENTQPKIETAVEEKLTEALPKKVENKKEVAKKPDKSNRVGISPLAKKIAEENNINISFLKGTGDKGLIIKRDIETYLSQGRGAFTPMEVEEVEEIAHSQMRKTVAKRLSMSKFSAPHYYLSVEFDMDAVIEFRKQFNTLPDTKISFNDIVIKATALALKMHPEVNSQWTDTKIVQNKHVNIGVAVAVKDGLVVPVLKFANEQRLEDIGMKVKEYAVKARDKKLTPDEMEGSTFTISNLGMFGIEDFTSIINQPNSAILSVGAIIQKPVVKDGQIVIGNTIKLTLACDHRSIDGAMGATFLQTLKEFIENPIRLVV